MVAYNHIIEKPVKNKMEIRIKKREYRKEITTVAKRRIRYMPRPCPALRALCPEFLEHQDKIIPGWPNKDGSKPYALNINGGYPAPGLSPP